MNVRTLVARLDAWLDRLRVRWYRWRRLPTVADLLAAGSPLPGPPARALPPADAPLDSPDPRRFTSIPSTVLLLSGRPAPIFRVASTTMLPPPPVPLEVLRALSWPLGDRAPPRPVDPPPSVGERGGRLTSVPTPRPPFAPVRSEAFQLSDDLDSSRPERRGPATRPALRPTVRVNLAGVAPRRKPSAPAPTLDLRKFGLLPDGRPPSEDPPFESRQPRLLPPGPASFVAKYVDPVRAPESWVLPPPETFGEKVRTKVARFFVEVKLGASGQPKERAVRDDVEDWMQEVREQFLLRRDTEKVELDQEDLGSLAEGVRQPEAIRAYTGLTFTELEPEPFRPLEIRLANPSVDMVPTVESLERRVAQLVAAVREPREEPPAGAAT